MTTRLTIERYLDRCADDPRWTQLIDGEVVVMQPTATHGELHARLIWALREHQQALGGITVFAPTGVWLTEHDVFGPDVVVTKANPELTERGFFVELPLLCAEVRSPDTWRYDVGHKWNTYAAQGVPELWLVDSYSQTVLVFRRATAQSATFDVSLELGRGETLTTPLLPGFALPLDELFSS